MRARAGYWTIAARTGVTHSAAIDRTLLLLRMGACRAWLDLMLVSTGTFSSSRFADLAPQPSCSDDCPHGTGAALAVLLPRASSRGQSLRISGLGVADCWALGERMLCRWGPTWQ